MLGATTSLKLSETGTMSLLWLRTSVFWSANGGSVLTSQVCWETPEIMSANTLAFSAPSLPALRPQVTFQSKDKKLSDAHCGLPLLLFTPHQPHWPHADPQVPACSHLGAFTLPFPLLRCFPLSSPKAGPSSTLQILFLKSPSLKVLSKEPAYPILPPIQHRQ